MSIWSEKGLFPQSKTQNFHLLVCQRHDFLAQPGVVVIMCFFHCPGSNGTTTCYCRETDNVANTRFLGHFCTPTMLHLRAFVANQVLSPIRAYFGLFCPDFYSDIADFTQIFCRYLPKKLVAKTSVRGLSRLRLSEFVQISEFFSIYITDICQTSESFAKSVNLK